VLAGIWPTPLADVAAAVVGVVVVWLLRETLKLAERVSRLEGRLDERGGDGR